MLWWIAIISLWILLLAAGGVILLLSREVVSVTKRIDALEAQVQIVKNSGPPTIIVESAATQNSAGDLIAAGTLRE